MFKLFGREVYVIKPVVEEKAFTAEEARLATQEGIRLKAKREENYAMMEYNDVLKKIKKATSDGFCSIALDHLRLVNQEKLKEMGYDVYFRQYWYPHRTCYYVEWPEMD